ncbi:hypothetical protein CYMTET_47220 [Cymbomonas tetramitiformis]|uniref:Uncharacterized protein n=1 Tax=Cymbomonas tetramitiformis TaxID=36881 RepID=A0AAE0BVQ9_9CHLO|nr:hypothetical protein CYMTET_47220 [Cymbomonas tetramitiformis]
MGNKVRRVSDIFVARRKPHWPPHTPDAFDRVGFVLTIPCNHPVGLGGDTTEDSEEVEADKNSGEAEANSGEAEANSGVAEANSGKGGEKKAAVGEGAEEERANSEGGGGGEFGGGGGEFGEGGGEEGGGGEDELSELAPFNSGIRVSIKGTTVAVAKKITTITEVAQVKNAIRTLAGMLEKSSSGPRVVRAKGVGVYIDVRHST